LRSILQIVEELTMLQADLAFLIAPAAVEAEIERQNL